MRLDGVATLLDALERHGVRYAVFAGARRGGARVRPCDTVRLRDRDDAQRLVEAFGFEDEPSVGGSAGEG
jgi:hypothetical protein